MPVFVKYKFETEWVESMDFYGDKADDIPRLRYRALISKLENQSLESSRNQIIQAFLDDISANHLRDDFMKMKMVIPNSLQAVLSPAEFDLLEQGFKHLRQRRNARLNPIYPTCSDEFKFDNSFFTSVFRNKPEPVFSRKSKVFTVGSCFAVNIAKYLSSKGYNFSAYARAENINSVFGNALLLSLLQKSSDEQLKFVQKTLGMLLPAGDMFDTEVQKEVRILQKVKVKMETSDVLVVTLGNTIDAFFNEQFADWESPNVYPRFFNSLVGNSVEGQAAVSQALKSLGGTFRLAGLKEALPAVEQMVTSLRGINPKARIFVTVSPVAILNTMGISEFEGRGPVEADCATKCTLRACIEEVLQTSGLSNVRYFPSFEIVRWLGSTSDQAAFGAEDASSIHVSQAILSSIYDYFEYLYAEDAAEV